MSFGAVDLLMLVFVLDWIDQWLRLRMFRRIRSDFLKGSYTGVSKIDRFACYGAYEAITVIIGRQHERFLYSSLFLSIAATFYGFVKTGLVVIS